MNGYWPAQAMLAQHLTDIGSVSACTARPAAQQTRGVEPVLCEDISEVKSVKCTGCEDIKTVAQLIEPKDDLVTVDHLLGSKS